MTPRSCIFCSVGRNCALAMGKANPPARDWLRLKLERVGMFGPAVTLIAGPDVRGRELTKIPLPPRSTVFRCESSAQAKPKRGAKLLKSPLYKLSGGE